MATTVSILISFELEFSLWKKVSLFKKVFKKKHTMFYNVIHGVLTIGVHCALAFWGEFLTAYISFLEIKGILLWRPRPRLYSAYNNSEFQNFQSVKEISISVTPKSHSRPVADISEEPMSIWPTPRNEKFGYDRCSHFIVLISRFEWATSL